MVGKQVYVKNDGTGVDDALKATDKFARSLDLTGKNSMHLRLLAEEMLGMVRAITGRFTALYWAEGDEKEVKLCLKADTEMNPEKRRELISTSSSGKNKAARGFMGKIKELIEIGMENYDEVSRLQVKYGVDPVSYGSTGMGVDNEIMAQAALSWSLENYRKSLSGAKNENEGFVEAWDELEKSIVANLADDVQVGIQNDKVEFIVVKKF